MTPREFAIVVIRLVAIGLVIHTSYESIHALLYFPKSMEMMPDMNEAKYQSLIWDGILMNAKIKGGWSIVLFLGAPLLASIATFGMKKRD